MRAKDIMRKNVITVERWRTLPELAKTFEIMTPGAIALDEMTPVEKVAKVMIDSRIHRVLITRAARLVGIVTTMDFIRALVVLANKKPVKRQRALVM